MKKKYIHICICSILCSLKLFCVLIFFFYNSFIVELSSLNVFFSPDNGKTVMISTSENFIQGPILGLNCRYSKKPTGQKYHTEDCVHKWEFVSFDQIRCNDEAPSKVMRCIHCNHINIHH